jgi:hypothetical protein
VARTNAVGSRALAAILRPKHFLAIDSKRIAIAVDVVEFGRPGEVPLRKFADLQIVGG